MADPEYPAEKWLTIPFAPNYAASDLGRIKRIADQPTRFHGNLLRPKVAPDGYLGLCLYVDGKRISYRVHTLICRTFHGECPLDKDEAGHRDSNRANARADNLRWVTKSENWADRNDNGTAYRGVDHPNAKLDLTKVEAIKVMGKSMSVRKIAHVVGISKSQVWNILNGESWQGSPVTV